MKIAFLLCALALPFPALAQDKPQDKMHTPHILERQINKTVRTDYLLFLPQNYEAENKKSFPLILFLHGGGERGSDVWKTSVHGPSKYIKDNFDFPFIVVSPLCPGGETWSNETLLGLLDEVTKRYRVDKSRIYLTGISMGGYGSWNLAMAHPERFAAVAPICGGGEMINVILIARGFAGQEKLKALRTLPVWAFHGAKDTVVPITESERMIRALEQVKAENVKFTVYPEANHDSWTETYKNPELYHWFLQHSR